MAGSLRLPQRRNDAICGMKIQPNNAPLAFGMTGLSDQETYPGISWVFFLENQRRIGEHPI